MQKLIASYKKNSLRDAIFSIALLAISFISILFILFNIAISIAQIIFTLSIAILCASAGVTIAWQLFIKKLKQTGLYSLQKPIIIPGSIIAIFTIFVALTGLSYLITPTELLLDKTLDIWVKVLPSCMAIIAFISTIYNYYMHKEYKYVSNPSAKYKEHLIWISTYMDIAELDEDARLYVYNQIDETEKSAAEARSKLEHGSCVLAAKVNKFLND